MSGVTANRDGALTELSGARVPQLLYPTPHLLRCAALTGRLEDVVRDELVAHGEATENAIRLRFCRSVSLEACTVVTMAHNVERWNVIHPR